MILGASFDTIEENKAFADAEGFPYRLLSDPNKTAGERYEVVRAPDHQFANFPERFSYLIDPSGVIHAAYNVTDVAGHPQHVLDDIRAASPT